MVEGGAPPTIRDEPDDMREIIRIVFTRCVSEQVAIERASIQQDSEAVITKFMHQGGFYESFSNLFLITRLAFQKVKLQTTAGRTELGKLLDEIVAWRGKIKAKDISVDTIEEGVRLFEKYGQELKTEGVLKIT